MVLVLRVWEGEFRELLRSEIRKLGGTDEGRDCDSVVEEAPGLKGSWSEA